MNTETIIEMVELYASLNRLYFNRHVKSGGLAFEHVKTAMGEVRMAIRSAVEEVKSDNSASD